MSIKIKESELLEILAEVQQDLDGLSKSALGGLSKAEGDEPPGDDAPPAEGSEGSSPAPEASLADESAAPSAPPAADSASPEAGSPAPEGSMDPAAEQGAALTPEALQAEYAQLSPEELDMHLQAALAAKQALAGGAPGAPDAGMAPPAGAPGPDMGMGAPPAGPAGSPSPDPMAMKSELPASPERNGKNSIDAVAKSEFQAVNKRYNDEIEALKALVKSQAEDITNLVKATKLVVEQPMRKAVTSVAHLAKTEAPKKSLANLTKQDIHEHLKAKSATPGLKKSDRELINGFYENRVSITKLEHLFEDYK